MASTFTTGFGIEKIGSGEQSGTWGTTTNHNLDIVDRIASYKAVALSGTTHTLTVREASPGSGTENLQDGMYRVIKFTGALGANNTVTIAPNTAPAYFIIENATTDSGSGGPYSVILSQGSGANVTVQNGKNAIVYCDGAGSGAAVVDALADLQVGTLEVTGAAAIDGALTGSSTIQGTTITATTAFVPDASDGAALGTTSLEFSDLYLADEAVIGFGDDQDVTLTHVADTGLLLNSTMALQFNDATQYINAPSATVLDINATDEIELNATLVDVNANLDVSGTLTQAGASQFNSTITVGADDQGYDVKFFGDTASAYLLWDTSTDDLILGGSAKMGIGTTSPGAELEIAGDYQPLIVNSTNSSTFKTVFEDNGTTRGYLGAASGVSFVIGRASDAASQFQFKDLNGHSQLYFAASTTAGGGAGGAYLQALGSNAASPPQIAGIDMSMTDGTDGSESGIIAFHTTNSGTSGERMRILANGQIAIGGSTAATGAALTVEGSDTAAGSLNYVAAIRNSDAYSTTPAAGILFQGKYNSAGSYADAGGIEVVKENATDGEYGFGLGLHTRANGASITEKLHITGAGLLGLGTAAPTEEIHILATAPTIKLEDSQNNYAGYINGDNGSILLQSLNSARDIIFGENAASGELMRVMGTGLVGIGTASPNQLLHINSSTSANINLTAASGYLSQILFGDTATPNHGRIMYNAGTGHMSWATNNSATAKMELDDAGALSIVGALSKGSGSFKIDHPLPAKKDTHHLVHSFTESPQADLIYRGRATLVDGEVSVDIDEAAGMTSGTFEALCRDVQCFTSNETGWTAVRGSVSGATLTIEAQDNSCTDTISWMVVGERQDEHMYDTNWTDDDGRVIVEPLKPGEEEEE